MVENDRTYRPDLYQVVFSSDDAVGLTLVEASDASGLAALFLVTRRQAGVEEVNIAEQSSRQQTQSGTTPATNQQARKRHRSSISSTTDNPALKRQNMLRELVGDYVGDNKG